MELQVNTPAGVLGSSYQASKTLFSVSSDREKLQRAGGREVAVGRGRQREGRVKLVPTFNKMMIKELSRTLLVCNYNIISNQGLRLLRGGGFTLGAGLNLRQILPEQDLPEQ